MRSLHLNNVAGVPSLLCRALKDIGEDGRVVAFRDDERFPSDDTLGINRVPRLLQPLHRLARLVKDYRHEDVYHYHSSAFLPAYLDVPALRALGKPVVLHHHGSDIRDKGIPFLARKADHRYVSTPDLLDWAPDAEWLPNPFFRNDYANALGSQKKAKRTTSSRKPILVGHSPKGKSAHRKSDAIQRVCIKLQREGLVRYETFDNLTHAEFVRRQSQLDVYIDNLGGGWYGMAALQAMSMHVPVIVYVREDLTHYGDERAYVNANEQNLERKLRTLAQDATLRKGYAARGFDYVKRTHDAHAIARRVTKTYREIMK